MIKVIESLRLSSERKLEIVKEIKEGSQPSGSFYTLLLAASLIASFGLMANSTAVVIGAMLVSPLMTPILGMSLALVRGSGKVFWRATQAEIFGVILAVGVAALFGLLPMNIEATPEMLARTQPNLLDLLVAVLAGFAGAYAMVDERISPALPGVAIATAIVPPLANTGLCLGIGAYAGAWGSFLLFFANFISILLVAAAVFLAAGLASEIVWKSPWDFMRRFAWATLAFLVLIVVLSNALMEMIQTRKLDRAIKEVLTVELANLSYASLDKQMHKTQNNEVYVLAMVRAPRIIPPDQVKNIQDALFRRLEKPINLIVRTTIARDTSAVGSTSQVVEQNLDGNFMNAKISDKEMILKDAEQVLWEQLASRPDLKFVNVDYGQAPRGKIILAAIEGLRPPSAEEIRKIEHLIQERVQDPALSLIVRFTPSILLDRYGQGLYGWSFSGELTPEKQKLSGDIQVAVNQVFRTHYPDVHPVRLYYNLLGNTWKILVEATGTGTLSFKDRIRIEKMVAEKVAHPVQVSIWFRVETVLTEGGEIPFQTFIQTNLNQLQEIYLKEWAKVK
jgi:uncharacterized hydrophobic protein (TIGR00271 family)